MIKTKTNKRTYIKPACETIIVEGFGYMMETSMSGQHNPAQPGTGPTPVNNTKQGWLEEEEDENLSTNFSIW